MGTRLSKPSGRARNGGRFSKHAYSWQSVRVDSKARAGGARGFFTPRPHTLETVLDLRYGILAVFSEGLGYQMGFARCEKVPRQRDARSIAQFQGGMAIRALAAPVSGAKAKNVVQYRHGFELFYLSLGSEERREAEMGKAIEIDRGESW